MAFTPEQASAITTHDRDVVVVAGAGSGKTFVLVERYLALLDANPDMPLNAIAAITFTEKAAGEMKSRARDGITKRLLAASTPEASWLWSARLAAMDSARIGTIHSLCATILRANAADVGIDPAFTVLDEIAARLLTRTAVDAALRDSDEAVTALLSVYDGTRVREAIIHLVSQDLPPTGDPEVIFAGWQVLWRADRQDKVAAFFAWVPSSAFATWTAGVPDGDTLGAIWREAQAVIAQAQATDDRDAQASLIISLGTRIALRGGSAKTWGDADIFRDAKAALTELREWVREQFADADPPDADRDGEAARLIPHWARLAQRAQERYRQLKSDRAALDFDDLERLAADVLARPSVEARYVGAEIRYVMVDEFQDTNERQWQIARALTAGRSGALFVVGDPKQSIYAFRGADVRVFKAVQATITDGGGARISMMQSFRTHQTLVDSFNAVFEQLLHADHPSAVEFGDPMRAVRAAPSASPSLELSLIVKSDILAKDRESDDLTERQREAVAIAARINALIAAGDLHVYDKDAQQTRPVGYGDITILFQAMTHAQDYEEALKDAAIPYVTVAGRGFYDRQEIWDALNLLRAVYNGEDDLAVASVLRSPFFMISDDALLHLRWAASAAGIRRLMDAVTAPGDLSFAPEMPDADREPLRFAGQTLAHLRGLAGRISIADLLREGYARTGYLAILTLLRGGVRLRANAEKLIALAETSQQIALGAFMSTINDLRSLEAREGEATLDAAHAVRLMTVHKSKGLEFPVVILADASYKWRSGRDGDEVVTVNEDGWACRLYDEDTATYTDTFATRRRKTLAKQREDAERRRLLYVAATRAADHLIVSGTMEWDKNGVVSANGWLDWWFEVLALRDLNINETERQTDAGRVTLQFHTEDEDAHAQPAADDAEAFGWDTRAFTGTGQAPPLIGQVARGRRTRRDITVTQLADLGAARHALPAETRRFYRERWRRSVDGGVSLPIPTVTDAPRRAHASVMGKIVHRAIQYDLPDGKCEVADLLDQYAWEYGVLDDAERAALVAKSKILLEGVLEGEVYRWLADAKTVHRELPFVYTTATTPQRTIHGIIDLLIERADGVWVVVDFKTMVIWGDANGVIRQADAEAHATRYHLQVGVYAAAVEALLGIIPLTFIDYIQVPAMVEVPEAAWRGALAELETHFGDLFADEA